MTKQETVDIVIKSDADKSIESISLGTKVIPVTNKDEMTVTVKAGELDVGTTRMYVQFMSKVVEEKDTAKGETEVEQQKLGCTFVDNVQNEDGTSTNYVEKIDTNMTIEQFIEKVDTEYSDVEILDANREKVKDTSKGLATGMILKIDHKGNDLESLEDDYTVEYSVVVHGDITGTGSIEVNDITRWRENIVDLITLEGAYLRACDYDGDGTLTVSDLTAMREALLFN